MDTQFTEARSGALLDNTPGGIVYAERGADGAFKVLYASRGLAEILGYADSEACLAALASDPSAGVSERDADEIKSKLSEAFSGIKQFRHSFRCAASNGDEVWLMLHGSAVITEEGRQGICAFVSDVTAEKNVENELRITAYYDILTGLYNRSAFIKSAQTLLDGNPATEYSMLKLDIDNFKVINDIYGRAVGDRILIQIADVLRELIGGNGLYARLFADHFAVMIPYSERSVHPQVILDTIQKAIAESCGLSHDIQLYIGVYKVTDRSLTADNMIDRASIACRSISGSFREHIAYYGEGMRKKILEEQEIRDEARRALQNGEFYICYQPVYGIKAKKFVSAEALVRWNHPTKGQIQPARFVPVFEKNGFVAELDLYVLEQVCVYMKKRADEGLPPFPISVNVSRMSLYNPNLFSIIREFTAKYNIDPQYFRIEITETAYNDNPAQLLETIGKLREKGYPILMDDFGSGYSSLNTLKDIPIDILKLDMKFMEGFEKNSKVGTIVTAIARMSKWLNVPLLAEGVETKEQYDFLVSVGCSYIQGFYFSRPVPEADFTGLVSMDEVTAIGENIENVSENVGMDFNIDELLGGNHVISKFLNSVFGGLGIYELVDDRLELIRVNDGYMQILGYSVDDLNGVNLNVWEHVHPDDVEKSKNACLETMKTDKAVRVVVRRYDHDGRLLYLEGTHRRVGGSDDEPVFVIAFNDITDSLKKEKLIKLTASRTEEVLASTNSLVVDVDFESNEVFLAGDTNFNLNLDTVDAYTAPTSPFVDIVHPDDLEKAEKLHSDLTPGRKSAEMRLKRLSDGEYYWWRITVIRQFDDDGKLSRLLGTATNINVEKAVQTAIKQANIESVIHGFDGGIALVDNIGGSFRTEMANDKFYEILGVHRGDEQRVSQIMSAVLSTETGVADLRIRKDRTTNTVRIRVEKDHSHNTDVRRYVVTVNDVTLKRAETKNRIAERMNYAAEGVYDEIYEINTRMRTMKMVSSRRLPDMANNAKPFPLDAVLRGWVEKAIHPSDVTEVTKLLLTPLNDPEFTDAYSSVKLKDLYGDGEYHDCGIAVVRSKADACMVFIHDNTRRERSLTATTSNETDRMFRTVIEHTRMTALEYDCASNRVVCSTSLDEYAVPGLSEDGFCGNGGFGGIFDIHPDDKAVYSEYIKTLCETEDERIVSVRMKTAAGNYEWRRLTAFLKRDSARNPAKLVMAVSPAVSDVQALKNAGGSDMLLQNTVNNIPIGIGVFRMENGEPTPVYISDNVYALYGIEKGKTDAPLLPADKLFEDGEIYDGASGEYALESYHADGSKFWLSLNYRVIAQQDGLMLYAAFSDASDRVESLRQTSNQQAAEQQMYQVLLSETGTILFEYNTATDVLKYFSHEDGERSAITELAGVLEDPSEFVLLRDMDRVNFFMMLGELIADPGSGELPVRVVVDGYPRRYKVFMKSVCDLDGKVYEIIGKMEDAEDEMERLDKIRAKAMYDSLCVNVYNKSTAEELIRTALDQSTGGALLMVDVDDFTRIGDVLGHTASDEFLKNFANVVRGVFRDTDIVGRYGNDEFVVFMQHVPASLAEIKGGIILGRAAGIQLPELGSVKCSVGVAVVTPENRNYYKLLKQADGALTRAKNNGKNNVVVFDPETMEESTYRATVTEAALETSSGKTPSIVLSSNPNSASSVAMRVFSALYSSTDLSAGVHDALEIIGREFNVSRVYIFEDSVGGGHTTLNYEWCNTGIPSGKAHLQNVSFEHDWGIHYLDYMNDDGIFYCHDVTALENPVVREVFERHGIKSVLECAIREDGFKGFIGFDECLGNRFWTQDQIDSLVFLSKVLAVFLIKNRLEKNG